VLAAEDEHEVLGEQIGDGGSSVRVALDIRVRLCPVHSQIAEDRSHRAHGAFGRRHSLSPTVTPIPSSPNSRDHDLADPTDPARGHADSVIAEFT